MAWPLHFILCAICAIPLCPLWLMDFFFLIYAIQICECMIPEIQNLKPTSRIISLRNKTLSSPRFLSIEQAKIITRIYQENESLPVNLKRAKALAASLLEMPIAIDPEELIVGNRTPDIRAGVVFPEAGINWLLKEIDTLPERPQDPFIVKEKDKTYFREVIEPYWRSKTLEDDIYRSL